LQAEQPAFDAHTPATPPFTRRRPPGYARVIRRLLLPHQTPDASADASASFPTPATPSAAAQRRAGQRFFAYCSCRRCPMLSF